MATKVKGEAIKEGSIPLSALAKEVKDKIENAGAGGGADWNAKEGEDGYIKNRTHSAKIINPIVSSDTLIEYNWNTDYNKLYMIFPSNLGGYKILYLPHGNPMTISGNEFFEVDKYSIDIEWDGDSSIRMVFVEGGANNFAQSFMQSLTVGEYVQLSDVYIPDTVIKTTPQTLYKGARDQALANLGIDPVVWKYLTNPFLIDIDKTTKIPEDLLRVIFNYDEFDAGLHPITSNVIKCIKGDDIYMITYTAYGEIIVSYGGSSWSIYINEDDGTLTITNN